MTRAAMLVDTPVGAMTLIEEDGALIEARFGASQDEPLAETPLLIAARAQLNEYFAGARKSFDLPLNPRGTDFQRRCWRSLCDIPYGETISYGEQAARVGSPKACRAVGMANHNNPIPIIIPCHRVVGRGGSLTGYGGGLDVKAFLLELERRELSDADR